MLLDLGVAESKMKEPLDYYHAVEHLNRFKTIFTKRGTKNNNDCLKRATLERRCA